MGKFLCRITKIQRENTQMINFRNETLLIEIKRIINYITKTLYAFFELNKNKQQIERQKLPNSYEEKIISIVCYLLNKYNQ